MLDLVTDVVEKLPETEMLEKEPVAMELEVAEQLEPARSESIASRLGMFAAKCIVAAAVFVPAGILIAQQGSSRVADELKPTINENGTHLRNALSQEIDPTTQDLQEFMVQADKFFADYEEFKVGVCRSGVIKLESCPEVLARADEKKETGSQDAAASPMTITEPPAEIPVVTTLPPESTGNTAP